MFNDKFNKYKINRSKRTSFEEDLEKIRPYFGDMIDRFKKLGEWKIQLIMNVNFISSKDSDDKQLMYFKSDNIEIMIRNETNEIMK